VGELTWFEDVPVLGELPLGLAAAKLRELGEDQAADALTDVAEEGTTPMLHRGWWPFRDRPWQHIAHAIGRLAPSSQGDGTGTGPPHELRSTSRSPKAVTDLARPRHAAHKTTETAHLSTVPAQPNGLALGRFSVICATPLRVITPRSPVQGSCAVPEYLCLTRPYVPKARTLTPEPWPGGGSHTTRTIWSCPAPIRAVAADRRQLQFRLQFATVQRRVSHKQRPVD
jgi:hypothetical protein